MSRGASRLEREFEARGNTSRRRHRRSGEQARKINHIQSIGEVGHLNLHCRTALLFAIKLSTCRRVHSEIRPHTPAAEIHAVRNRCSKLRQ